MKHSLAVLLVVALFCQVSAQQDASSILGEMDKTVFSIKDKTVTMRMVMTNLKTGKEKEKEAVLMQKDLDKKLFRYTAPESDAGISTLSLPNDEIYVYLPMFKKPKKITNLAESGIFTSSDFSIDDMANQSYSEKYTATLVSSDGENHVLSLAPTAEKPTWNRVEVHINKQHFYPVRFDYFGKKDAVEKQALYNYVQVNGFWVADQVSMEDLKKQHKTTLFMSDIKVNSGLEDALFALENLVPGG